MNRSKNNPQSQQTRNNFNLLTQTGGIMPEPNGQVAETNMTPSAAATALIEKRAQIDRFIDSILFG
jgi:hypothetical protein